MSTEGVSCSPIDLMPCLDEDLVVGCGCDAIEELPRRRAWGWQSNAIGPGTAAANQWQQNSLPVDPDGGDELATWT